MATEIDFYWDLGSTNSYFALKLIQPLAAKYGASVKWHPFNVGFVFRANRYVLMDEPPAKLKNRRDDLMRWARKHDLPFRIPDVFPIKTSRALRGAIAMRHWDLELPFMKAMFETYWEQGNGEIGSYTVLNTLADKLGVPAEAFEARAESDEVRQALIASTNAALERDVFGVPSIYIEDELYWGKDRMEFVEDHLARLASGR